MCKKCIQKAPKKLLKEIKDDQNKRRYELSAWNRKLNIVRMVFFSSDQSIKFLQYE